MGIQDDVFDVEHDIKDNNCTRSTLEKFSQIVSFMWQLEADNEELGKRDKAFKDFALLLNHHMNRKDERPEKEEQA